MPYALEALGRGCVSFYIDSARGCRLVNGEMPLQRRAPPSSLSQNIKDTTVPHCSISSLKRSYRPHHGLSFYRKAGELYPSRTTGGFILKSVPFSTPSSITGSTPGIRLSQGCPTTTYSSSGAPLWWTEDGVLQEKVVRHPSLPCPLPVEASQIGPLRHGFALDLLCR